MIFAKYLHTRDIGKLENMYAWFFLLWGHLGGGGHREFVGGGGARAPQAPRPPPP